MKFHIVTLFPEMLKPYFEEGILGRAKNKKEVIDIKLYNPRDFTLDKHRTVDERPFGGGPGMVLQALPILKAVDSALKEKVKGKKKKMVKIMILSPRGKKFDDKMAKKIAKDCTEVILISGRYEGIDARVKKALKDSLKRSKMKDERGAVEEVSVGDYTLSGGELPAAIVVDAVARKIPEVLGNIESLEESRLSTGEMYTRPEVLEWNGVKHKVPKVLLSGNHAKIEEWKKKKNK